MHMENVEGWRGREGERCVYILKSCCFILTHACVFTKMFWFRNNSAMRTQPMINNRRAVDFHRGGILAVARLPLNRELVHRAGASGTFAASCQPHELPCSPEEKVPCHAHVPKEQLRIVRSGCAPEPQLPRPQLDREGGRRGAGRSDGLDEGCAVERGEWEKRRQSNPSEQSKPR